MLPETVYTPNVFFFFPFSFVFHENVFNVTQGQTKKYFIYISYFSLSLFFSTLFPSLLILIYLCLTASLLSEQTQQRQPEKMSKRWQVRRRGVENILEEEAVSLLSLKCMVWFLLVYVSLLFFGLFVFFGGFFVLFLLNYYH